MNIGIDARELKRPHTGIGKYVINLVRMLTAIDQANRYVLFVESGQPALPFVLPDNFSLLRIPALGWDKLQDQAYIPARLLGLKLNVFHVVHHDAAPLIAGVPLVVTVPDIAPMDFYNPSRVHRSCYKLLTAAVLWRARYIICISRFIQARLAHYFPATQEKSFVVYLAADEYSPFNVPDRFNILEDRFNIHRPYILYVGSFANRKNIANMMQAVKIVKVQRPDVQIVLVGAPSGRVDYALTADDLLHVVLQDRGKTMDDLRLLYSCAHVMVFPSLYEGFGLPALEAMACGCPVVASSATSLLEVVGDAGILVDPLDAKAIANALLRVLSDPSLQAKMRRDSLAKAQQFSWRRVAEETLDIYKKAHHIHRL